MLSNEALNLTVVNSNNSNNNTSNSPHSSNMNARSSNQFYSSNNSQQTLESEMSTSNLINTNKINSTNNLLTTQIGLVSDTYDSPTLVCNNNRLSTGDRRLTNMSNNLSTSASLLDATTDDAMSSIAFFINNLLA